MTETSDLPTEAVEPAVPQTFTMQNEMPDGTLIIVEVMAPNDTWWEDVVPNTMLSLPVVAVRESRVKHVFRPGLEPPAQPSS